MKNLYFIFLLPFLTTCRDEVNTIEYSPFFSFLEQPNITIDTIEKAGSTWEYGFRFKSLKSQMIKRVGIKLPTTGNFEVKLYDLNLNKTILDTMVTSTTKLSESFISIPEIELQVNGLFGLTVKADAFIRIKDDRQIALQFPVTKGFIEIISFHEEDCDLVPCSGFPATTNSFVIAPCVNVTLVSQE